MENIQEVKNVWVAMTNTDLTEGRGFQYPFCVCESKSTAIRMGRKKYVMGSDCPIAKSIAVKINHEWLTPGRIISPTKEDIKLQEQIDAKEQLLKKLRDSGFTEDEIKLLRSGK